MSMFYATINASVAADVIARIGSSGGISKAVRAAVSKAVSKATTSSSSWVASRKAGRLARQLRRLSQVCRRRRRARQRRRAPAKVSACWQGQRRRGQAGGLKGGSTEECHLAGPQGRTCLTTSTRSVAFARSLRPRRRSGRRCAPTTCLAPAPTAQSTLIV